MKLFKICLAVAALSLCIVPEAYSRIIGFVSYQELFEKSDLVVIATPLTKTADTNERTFFQGMVQTDQDGKQTGTAAIGVETTFGVSVVMKGDRAAQQFILHHYRVAPYPARDGNGLVDVLIDGPNIVSFDPSDFRLPRDILLFLVKEQDGRYAPYGGQTDPGVQAITPLGPHP